MASCSTVKTLGMLFRNRQPSNYSSLLEQTKTGCRTLTMTSCPRRPFSSQEEDRHGHHHRRRRQQQRSTAHGRLRTSRNNPYDVLGIPRDSSADTVKRRFLQLALRHHPDTNRNDNSNDETASKHRTETFVKIRQAFERIKQDFANRSGDGATSSSSSWFTEEEFDEWFYRETGQKMDASTRREVMHVYRSGLTRTEYGAVWEIAFILEEEGFFAHKDKTSLQHNPHNNRDETDSGGGEKTANDDDSRKKSQARRKRTF